MSKVKKSASEDIAGMFMKPLRLAVLIRCKLGSLMLKLSQKSAKKKFEISRINRFRYRTRYFTDSGIIGSKEFVAENYHRFKHLFYSKHEKKPKPINGLDGMYSLKRLYEIV